MNTFPIFSRPHTDTYSDSEMGSLLLHSPWETHAQPRYWLFDQPPPPTIDNVVVEEYGRNQLEFMHEEYHHRQSPGMVPVNSCLELQPNDKEYSRSISSGTKKALHNARERHRRKTLKVLFSQLCSLLPITNPKKLSIPNTVSRVLKYIPQLRNEIEKLKKKRAKLRAATKQSICASSLVGSKYARITGAEGLIEFMRPPPLPANTGSPDHLTVTVNAVFGSSEMMVTICNCGVGILFSTLLVFLGKEGLDLLNASTFTFQDKVFHNLHLEMMAERSEVDPNLLEKKLLLLFSDKTSPHNRASKQLHLNGNVLKEMSCIPFHAQGALHPWNTTKTTVLHLTPSLQKN